MAHRSLQQFARRGGLGVANPFQVVSVRPATTSLEFTPAYQRLFSSTTFTAKREYAPNPLDAFRDPVDRQTRMEQPVGRQWSVAELRRKSYEDLHGLWYVLYKEKNMLLTEQQLSRRRQLIFPQPERMKKVQKSMGAIRQVLGERKRRAVAAHLERHEEKELARKMETEAEMAETFEAVDDDTTQEPTK